jgi:hypothetical protein
MEALLLAIILWIGFAVGAACGLLVTGALETPGSD